MNRIAVRCRAGRDAAKSGPVRADARRGARTGRSRARLATFSLALVLHAFVHAGCTPVGSDPGELAVPEEPEAVEAQAGHEHAPDVVQPQRPHPEDIDLSDLPDTACTPVDPRKDVVDVDPSEDPSTGMLMAKLSGDRWVGLPLRHTSFDTIVTGTVAETVVTQRFVNPLLEQERPNIFTQSVANIPPGASIDVGMHVVQPLSPTKGRYTLALPTVVGPRFIPGASAGAQSGTGMAAVADVVADASKLTPPVLPEGFRTCGDLAITVSIDAGVPVRGLRSRSHRVQSVSETAGAEVSLDERYAVLNRDVSLSWSLSGNEPTARLMADPDDDTREEVIDLSLQHHVITEFTAFVAVDAKTVVEGTGTDITVVQGVDAVHGMAQGMIHAFEYGGPQRPTGGLGNVGLIGHGGGGTGSGCGRGSGMGFGGGASGSGWPRHRSRAPWTATSSVASSATTSTRYGAATTTR